MKHIKIPMTIIPMVIAGVLHSLRGTQEGLVIIEIHTSTLPIVITVMSVLYAILTGVISNIVSRFLHLSP